MPHLIEAVGLEEGVQASTFLAKNLGKKLPPAWPSPHIPIIATRDATTEWDLSRLTFTSKSSSFQRLSGLNVSADRAETPGRDILPSWLAQDTCLAEDQREPASLRATTTGIRRC